jgi:lipopolysaccharide transport system ATP-binding protein
MKERDYQVGIFGTFDVENYGDLLFPLLAEAELSDRLGRVKLHRFSYHAKTPPHWPYEVTSLTELPQMASNLDGVLIGGGFIIRFDKGVAASYCPPTPAIHHPTGYWLTPALIALQHGIPLIWNAPGMHCNDIPAWAEPLVELVLAQSSYVAVRDESSQAALARFADKARINVLPDTAFGISRLLDEHQPSAEFKRLREVSGLTRPYIIVQATNCLEPFLGYVKNHAHWLRDFCFLVLPIGPVLGDREAIVSGELPRPVQLPYWPHPLLVAELISHSAAVVGHSYHLAITALAFGVPVFSSADLSVGKFAALSGFETVFPLPKATETDPAWLLRRLGKTVPTAAARAVRDQLAHYWDHVAALISAGNTGTQPAANRFWQALPNLLETAATRHEAAVKAAEIESTDLKRQLDTAAKTAELQRADLRMQINTAVKMAERQRANLKQEISEQAAALAELKAQSTEKQERIDELHKLLALAHTEKQERIDELHKLLALARTEIAMRDDRITALLNSTSWKTTAPLRFLMRRLKGIKEE